jgi:hypothetical protein
LDCSDSFGAAGQIVVIKRNSPEAFSRLRMFHVFGLGPKLFRPLYMVYLYRSGDLAKLIARASKKVNGTHTATTE